MTEGGEGVKGLKHKDDFRKRQSERFKGINNNNFGIKQSEYNKKRTVEVNSKTHLIQFPDGTINNVYNLNKFCKENNINRRRLYSKGDKGYSKYE